MEFTLYYRGPLKATTARNKRRAEKHELRKHFHTQLKELWNQTPLVDHKECLEPKSTLIRQWGWDEKGMWADRADDFTLLTETGVFQFAPTISDKLHMVADLTITLLRPEEPGQIVTQTGDIDNRLKTLLDALKIPSQPDDLPRLHLQKTSRPSFA